jgi:hypothetical protein
LKDNFLTRKEASLLCHNSQDDTCIGHMAHKEENLHTLISTDLQYLNAWSYRWLVKFNPNKTYYDF